MVGTEDADAWSRMLVAVCDKQNGARRTVAANTEPVASVTAFMCRSLVSTTTEIASVMF